jgi:hypothetical protein
VILNLITESQVIISGSNKFSNISVCTLWVSCLCQQICFCKLWRKWSFFFCSCTKWMGNERKTLRRWLFFCLTDKYSFAAWSCRIYSPCTNSRICWSSISTGIMVSEHDYRIMSIVHMYCCHTVTGLKFDNMGQAGSSSRMSFLLTLVGLNV